MEPPGDADEEPPDDQTAESGSIAEPEVNDSGFASPRGFDELLALACGGVGIVFIPVMMLGLVILRASAT